MLWNGSKILSLGEVEILRVWCSAVPPLSCECKLLSEEEKVKLMF